MQWERLADVNLNRLNESLKFIEDCTRFLFTKKKLLIAARNIRVAYRNIKKSISLTYIIAFRDSKKDAGRKEGFDTSDNRTLNELLFANLTRAKESSRTLEELFKLVNKRLSDKIKKIRFQIYDLEKEIVLQMSVPFDPRIQVILDEKHIASMAGKKIKNLINILQRNGATMIQLRLKQCSDKEFHRMASLIREAIYLSGVKYIINNRLDIALSCAADGIHLGQDDIPVARARAIAGDRLIIGASAHNVQQAIKAASEGANYLGVGAVYPTHTKLDAKLCGLHMLRLICRKVKIPVIGIGGINAQNYKAVIRAGAVGIAISSFIFEGSPRQNLRSLTWVKK